MQLYLNGLIVSKTTYIKFNFCDGVMVLACEPVAQIFHDNLLLHKSYARIIHNYLVHLEQQIFGEYLEDKQTPLSYRSGRQIKSCLYNLKIKKNIRDNLH